jgi:hypothetical protein
MTFAGYTCWQASDARAILSTEALEGGKAQFMATHTPIRNFEVEGTRPALVEESTEKGILNALTDRDLKHAFVVVEGEPGSGKSHLIRWLRVQWPHNNDQVVLVQRIEGSLDGTLRRLKDSLPPEFSHLFDGLGQVQSTSLAGRARDFQYRLGNSLTADYFEDDLPVHADWCGQWDVAKIVTNHVAVDNWSAPRRILEIISGKEGERNSELAQFTLADVAELGEMQREIQQIGPKAMMLLRHLGKEAVIIRQAQSEGRSLDLIADEVPNSWKLIEALNTKRLNHAIQNLLGISSQGLKELFRRLREALKKQDRRLVLLLEDITSFQGVDDQLIDALIAQSSTDEDNRLCDLISVVGITPAYYHKYLASLGNVLGRITFQVRLGSKDGGSGFQRVSALRESDERQQFAASYLRAVRAGRDQLEGWFNESKGLSAVPNRCAGCPHRETCHATFGAVSLDDQDVGLYPFNEQAVDHLFLALKDPKGDMTLQTPRGMLQGVLSPSLLKPQTIPDKAFPPPEVEHSWLPADEGLLLGQLQQIVAARGGDSSTQVRLRRMIAWWGHRDQAGTFAREDGELEFAGVPRTAFEAFYLPWLGSSEGDVLISVPPELEKESEPEPTSQTQRPTPADRHAEPTSATASQPAQIKPPAAKAGADTTGAKGTATPAKASRPGTVSDPELAKRRPELQNWLKGGRLEQGDYWSAHLREAMKQLPWRRLGIDQWLQQRLFTEALVTLEGAVKPTAMHFVVRREPWVQVGLDSYLVLRAKALPQGESEDFHYQNVARMLRKLTGLVEAHVARVMPQRTAEAPWSPAVSAAQVLLSRGWLRGTIRPDASPAVQWEAVLADETDPVSNMDRRVESWKEVVQDTMGSHDTIREMLRGMTNLTQDAWETNRGLCDAGEVAQSVLDFIRTLRFAPAPRDVKPSTQLAAVVRTAEVVQRVSSQMPHLPGREFERICRQSDVIDQACRRQALPAYLERVQKVFMQLPKVWPSTPATHLTEAAKAQEVLAKAQLLEGEDGGPLRRLDDFLADLALDADTIKARSAASLLAWDLDAPVKDLTLVRDQVDVFEKVLRQLDSDVQKYLAHAGETSPMKVEDIHVAGMKLEQSAKAVLAAMGSEP